MTTSRWIVVAVLVALPVAARASEYRLKLPLGLQEQAAFIPADNPLTPEKIAQQLFWDPWRSGEIRPLGLTAEEQADLVAFMRALTGEVSAEVTSPPRLPE